MAYASWSVVFGEQPSAAKWNILGTNDASFNDGTGIANGSILPNHLKASASTLNTWAWDSWTPSWTATGTAPAIGNGTLTGEYIQIGKTVIFRIKFIAGTTTTFGTGIWLFSLPVTLSTYYTSGTPSNIGFLLGGYMEDKAINGYGVVGGRFDAISTFKVLYSNSATGTVSLVGQTAPFTWGSTDYATFSGIYEIA